MTLKTRTSPRPPSPEPDFLLGWKEMFVETPEGGREWIQIPLTPEEALHPEEGYIMPESTDHARMIQRINEMLETRYAEDPNMAVYSDLIVKWDKPELKQHCPDVMVIPNVQNRAKQRRQFNVTKEGTRPLLIIEVVSPGSKAADRVKKVDQYARASVQEYVYMDAWERDEEVVWELAGFRLEGDRYLPMLPDEDRSLYCETVRLRIGITQGEIWMQDYETGKFLMTNRDAQARLTEEKATREALEARLAELEGREK